MTPFDNQAFRSWPVLVSGGFAFGLLFELPIILFDYVTLGSLSLSPASMLIGFGGFVGYVCIGGAIKTFGEVSD